MRFQVKHLWVLLLAILMGAPALKAGDIFVSNDEWMFVNGYLSTNNDAQFAQNIAAWLTGGSGKILIDSNNFGLNGTGPGSLDAELTGLGYTVSETFSNQQAPSFSGYNAVFVGGNSGEISQAALTAYVLSGGSVFVEAGTGDLGAAGEAAEWNTFLNAFGLNLVPSYNGVTGGTDVSAFQTQGGYSSALFGGVNSVFINNGNDVSLGLSGSAPADQVWYDQNGDGLYGAYATRAYTTPEPVSMLLFGTFLSLAGGLLGRKKRTV